MSFDVFFQGFVGGDAAAGGGPEMRGVLEPHIVEEEPEHDFVQIRVGAGSADLYLSDDSMMANHVVGDEPWEVLVAGARAAGWVLIPTGCSTCITDEGQRTALPTELQQDVVLIATGADLLAVIRAV